MKVSTFTIAYGASVTLCLVGVKELRLLVNIVVEENEREPPVLLPEPEWLMSVDVEVGLTLLIRGLETF